MKNRCTGPKSAFYHSIDVFESNNNSTYVRRKNNYLLFFELWAAVFRILHSSCSRMTVDCCGFQPAAAATNCRVAAASWNTKGSGSGSSGDSSLAYGYGKMRVVASLVGAASAVADQYSGSDGLGVDMSENRGGRRL